MQGPLGDAMLFRERLEGMREMLLATKHPRWPMFPVKRSYVMILLSPKHCVATLSSRQGKHAAADPLYARAIAIREEVLGPDHPDFAKWLTNRAESSKEQVGAMRCWQEFLQDPHRSSIASSRGGQPPLLHGQGMRISRTFTRVLEGHTTNITSSLYFRRVRNS